MRVVIQRVARASVTIGGEIHSTIGRGLLILLGVGVEDTAADIDLLVKKIVRLRIFPDSEGVMNISVQDISGDILVVSQFTLMACCRKGNRPSYIKAARPEISIPLYEEFCRRLSDVLGKPVGTGVFGADMQVELLNDGPVTIVLDTKNLE
jgi:D-tyrosyl-tRNA(Tyr) deacylase